MENKKIEERRETEIVYSRAVKAGKRIYYLDVKKARNEDLYLCITESKRKSAEAEGSPIQLEKHRLFLYKEDFSHFTEGLKDVIAFVESQVGEIEERQIFTPQDSEQEPEVSIEITIDDTQAEESEAKPMRKGFFSRFRSK